LVTVANVSIYRGSVYIDDEENAWIGGDKVSAKLITKHFIPIQLSQPQLQRVGQPFELSNIELEYNGFFSFDFLRFYRAAGLKYAYFLKGFDKDWMMADKILQAILIMPSVNTLCLRTQYGLE
jgi:hypothetical protein